MVAAGRPSATEDFEPRTRLDPEAGYDLRGLGGLGTVTPMPCHAVRGCLVGKEAGGQRPAGFRSHTPRTGLSGLERTHPRPEASGNLNRLHGLM